jgi:ABC-type glycerol-3-phosphate transport system substrate-binding protein
MTEKLTKGSRRGRRGSLVAAIVTTVALAATGCSATAEPAEPDGPVTLTFLNWAGSEDATKDNIAKVIAAFEAENPNITIESVPVPFDQLRTQALTQFAAGDPPDVIQLAQNVPFELASEDLLLDLSAEGFADQEWLDAHSGVSNGTVDDKLVAAPWFLAPYGLWYDKELMLTAGLDPNSPPATLEELISQSEQARDVLAAEGAYPIGIDTTSADNVLFQYLHFMYMFGAAPMEGGVANFDTPEVIDSLQFLQDAVANDLTPTGQGIRQLRELQRRLEAFLHRQLAVHDHGLQRGTLRRMKLREPLAALVLLDRRGLGHTVSVLRNLPGGARRFSKNQFWKGRSKALSRALASLSVFAVVTKTMSMPRIASTLS